MIGGYRKVREIGSGGSGEVFLVKDEMNILRAMKVIGGKFTHDHLQNEFKLVQSLQHPYVIKYHDLIHQDNVHYLVMEYFDALTLDRLALCLNQDDLWTITEQLLEVLTYLHSKNIVHSDIKPDNILFDGKQIKLIDFGLSNYNDQIGTMCGTLDYMAPEQILREEQFDSRPRDLWSAGVTLYELWTQQLPFWHVEPDFLSRLIVEVEPDFTKIEDLSMRGLVRRLLKKHPGERPTSSEVMNFL